MKLKMQKDVVVSIVKGRDLVGVYVIAECPNCREKEEILLAEVSPKKAKILVDAWNKN